LLADWAEKVKAAIGDFHKAISVIYHAVFYINFHHIDLSELFVLNDSSSL
jgi:hypothetical protein